MILLEETLMLTFIYLIMLQNATAIDKCKLPAKSNLASLKAEIDKLDTEKLGHVTVDLSKLNGLVKNIVIKKTMYDKLVGKVNNIDTSGIILKNKYDIEESDLKNKFVMQTKRFLIPGDLLKKLEYNAEITETEGKISSITGLITTSAFAPVEN